ncbi:alkaline phosphatase [Vibrio ishigakensis]|uniref:Alkaline phosphatase n=1 Tax=Vibrio ishigakensis TaxID=1481914 RepID=A0A0B8QMX8_9VIBR|nr:alkaline phosphatase [Vibrio ishigakensis]
MRTMKSTDADRSTAAADTISLGAGSDRVIAGLDTFTEELTETVNGIELITTIENDEVTSDSGNTHVISDNGVLTYNANGILVNAISTETDRGGDDEVTLGEGDNVVIAGFGADTVITAVVAISSWVITVSLTSMIKAYSLRLSPPLLTKVAMTPSMLGTAIIALSQALALTR